MSATSLQLVATLAGAGIVSGLIVWLSWKIERTAHKRDFAQRIVPTRR
jgi:hypothetical protein